MKTMTLDEFIAACKAQAKCRDEIVFICPMCGTLQSGKDFIEAGVGEDFEEIEKFIAYSCIGRWQGADSPRKKPDGKPCNWTLGGLLRTHKLEVITPDGKHHPRFELATKDAAAAHRQRPDWRRHD